MKIKGPSFSVLMSAFGLHVFRFLKSEDIPIICIMEKKEEIPWFSSGQDSELPLQGA